MSDTVHYKGTLVPVVGDLSLESKCGLICDEFGWEKIPDDEDLDTYAKVVCEEGYKLFEIIDGIIYKVTIVEQDPYMGIFRATKHNNGTVDFEVKYYNGGCSFTEALEAALANCHCD